MPIILIDTLGKAGLNLDSNPQTLAPEYITEGKNIRFRNGELQKFLGSEIFYDTWPTGNQVLELLQSEDVSTITTYGASATKIFKFTAGGVSDVSRRKVTTITANTAANPTSVTAAGHEIDNGETVVIAGSNSTPTIDGSRVATVTGANTFTVPVNVTVPGTAGTVSSSDDYNGTATSIWSGCILGGVPIFNVDGFTDVPQFYNGATGYFEDLTYWPVGYSCSIMRNYKQYLVALDINTPSGREPYTVKWSSPALPGAVPDYWDNADTNDSGEQPLSDGGGILLDCAQLNDHNMVYKEEATYIMALTSGPYVFQFYKVSSISGILAPRCVKDFFGKHFVVTKSDVVITDGRNFESVIDKRNRTWLFANMTAGSQRATYVSHNSRYNEMWICFVSNETTGSYPDKALVWNYKENTWGIRNLLNIPCMTLGYVDSSGISTYIDDITTLIDADTGLIDGNPFNQGTLKLIGASSTTRNLVEFDSSNLDETNVMESYAIRTGLSIFGKDFRGDWKVNPTIKKFIRRIYPNMEATGAVNFYIGSQIVYGGAISWSGPYSFNPNTLRYFDCRVQGNIMAYRITSDSDITWNITGLSIDMEVLGGAVRQG